MMKPSADALRRAKPSLVFAHRDDTPPGATPMRLLRNVDFLQRQAARVTVACC